MIRNHLRIVLRSIYKNKLFSFINILGLGIGLGSVILLATFLIHEFSFDRYHSKSNQIYRVVDGKNCKTYYAMGEAFTNDIPEIEKVCRITNLSDVYTVILNRDNESYQINTFMSVDPSLFDILDIKMIQGSEVSSHFTPSVVYISDRMAKKYFGNTNSVGHNLEFYIANTKQTLQVAGVYKYMPTNSSFQTDFICHISLAMSQFADLEFSLGLRDEKRSIDYYTDWEHCNEFTTIALLNKKANITDIEKKCSDIYLKYRNDLKDGGIHLQPYHEMYLQSAGLENVKTLKVSRFESLRIFLSIGILILLVACLNYILISSSELKHSFTEIACRKVNGASGRQIVYLVLLKSFIISIASLIPAFIFVKLSMPFFNSYFQKELDFSLFFEWQYIVAMLLITTITAVFAGLYLSIMAVRTNPSGLLQNKAQSSTGSKYFNNALLVVQFVVFIMLLSCMLLMKKQMNYSLNKDMGFKSGNLMVVNLGTERIKKQYQAIINQVQKNPHVLECQPTTDFLPPNENILLASFKDETTGKALNQEAIFIAVGNLELLNIPIIEGESFTESNAENRSNILINEAAVKKYEIKSGDNLFHFNVLGVLKNFHNKSIHEPIRPLFILAQTARFTNLLIKTDGNNTQVADQIRKIIQVIEPGYYFESELLSDRISEFYKTDKQHTEIISFFSFIALVLSFMGLYGFVTLKLSNQIKEIGIRKINGARVSQIITMLNKDYIIWVGIAFIIATPLSYFAINKWLQNFAYKTSLSWWVFILAGCIALAIALLTVSWQTFRAARKNPVEALRYE
ncbi:MAG: ABC transporter permease [Salinivirgaceae bacterium]|jgi:putative ABC transport system permease protein|nr:ABC transporter permease [Salinivirgaceae bacterium]